MLRSVSARWFELMVPRESVARALEALAATGRVELEPNSADEEDLIPIPQVDLELAKLAEHREKNLSDAIQWTEKAFSLIDKSHPNAVETFDNLIHRRNRILRKMGNKIEQQEFTG